MSNKPIKRNRKVQSGYSLIELMVVLGLIILIGMLGIPNIANSNDKTKLDQSAQRIKQMIIDARTRSLAPTKNDGSKIAQVYQVSFGDLSGASSSMGGQWLGTANTNDVALEAGLAQCDSADLQGGFTQVRDLALPRGIYISKFYPAFHSPSDTDTKAIIRFSVGKVGFDCGRYSSPITNSVNYDNAWTGLTLSSTSTIARYLLIELSVRKSSEKRYIAVDRMTSEVSVSRTNPQDYFTSISDVWAPKWSEDNPPLLNDFTLSISCSQNNSTVTLTYPRANDRSTSATVVDPNLPVYYDMSWDIGDGVMRPIATSYYYDINQSRVVYRFTTTSISVGSQPRSIRVLVAASDQNGLYQPQTLNPTDLTLQWLDKTFTWSCGSAPITIGPSPVPIGEEYDQSDPGGFKAGAVAVQAPQL